MIGQDPDALLAYLERQAEKYGVTISSDATLKKYGLSRLDWLVLLENQSWICPIMGMLPKDGRFVIDHEHVRGWKAMAPEERRKHVRGLVSRFANGNYLKRGLSVERAARVLDYLKAHEMRRDR